MVPVSRYYRQHSLSPSECGPVSFSINVLISYTEQLVAIIKATLMAVSGFVTLCTLLFWTNLF